MSNISLLDYYAGQALKALLNTHLPNSEAPLFEITDKAFEIAHEMLVTRDEWIREGIINKEGDML